MKKKVFWRQLIWIWLPALFFCACSGAELALFNVDDDTLASYTYDWQASESNDTTILSCSQKIVYQANGSNHQLTPVAYVKFWAVQDTVAFDKDSDPKPVYKTASGSSSSNGIHPKRQYITRQFEFEDGQNIKAEAMFESFVYNAEGVEKSFPFMEISELGFAQAAYAAIAGHDGLFDADVDFNANWNVNGMTDNGSEKAVVSYVKKQVEAADALLKTEYSQGADWIGENTLSLFVKKVETWRIAGVKTSTYTAPGLEFSLSGGTNKTLETDNFDFAGTLKSAQTKKDDISSKGWTLKKGTVTQTVSFSNGGDTFDDIFSYPMYEASYLLDGKTFDFDLSVKFNETYAITNITDKGAMNTTSGSAVILGRNFAAQVVTNFSKKGDTPSPDPDPDPTPDPDPDPDPVPKYGKILDYKVTAVFNVSGLNSGEITKKAVVIRYEEGYQWGICAYNEAFPTAMAYVQSGYTGFNSAAYSKTAGAFRIARAEDNAAAIKWYAEDNSLIAAIDALTCKVYGWKNIVDGNYSSTIKGYQGSYANNRYSLTLTAPDGTAKTYASSAK